MNPFLTFQMLNASSYDCWNVRMNASYENMIATGLMYNAWSAPSNWCFSPYMSAPMGNAYLLDPAYTYAQTSHQLGVPLFQYNNQGYGNYGGMDGYIGDGFQYSTQNQYSPYGPYVQAPSQNNSGKSSGDTEEDEKFKAKYEKLSSLMNALKNYAESEDCGLSEDDKAKIKAAIIDARKSGKTPKERFEILYKSYLAVVENNQEDLKEFIVNNDKMGIDGKSSNSDKSIKAELLKIGYEYENTEVDSALLNLKDAITKMKDSNSEGETDSDLLAGINKDNILDIISSWNNDESYSQESIMDFIISKYNELKDPNSKETAKGSYIRPFVKGLLDKANEEKATLSKNHENSEKLNEAIKELETAYLEDNFNVLKSKFNELYKLTRLVAAENLQKRVEKNEHIGKLINIVDDTKKDLEKEGLLKDSENQDTNDTTIDGKDPYDFGKSLAKKLDGHTSDAMVKEIERGLKDINKDNVLGFLNGYYDKIGYKNKVAGTKEGLIESLDDDGWYKDDNGEDTQIPYELKKGILSAVLQKAEELGLKDDKNYTNLNNIMQKSISNYSDIYESHGWFKQNVKYSEQIDMYLQELYKTIQELQKTMEQKTQNKA